MADLWELLALLAAFYTWECCHWLPGESLVVCRSGKRGRIVPAWKILGDRRPALFLSDPWPWTEVFASARSAHASDLGLEDTQRALARVRTATRGLRIASSALWGWVLIAGPLLVVAFGLRIWPVLALAAISATIAVAVLFHRGHRALFPAERGQRAQSDLMLLLWPLGAMRAVATLTLRNLEDHQPLAVAIAVSRQMDWRAVARLALFDARQAGTGSAVATTALEKLLETAGVPPGELLAPPEPRHRDASAYCPRCHLQYIVAAGSCEACGDIALKGFAQSALRSAG